MGGQSGLTSPSRHERKRINRPTHGSLLHIRAEHKLMRHKLNETRVDEDARRDRIKNTIHQQRRAALGREALAYTKANSNGNWRGDAVAQTKQVGRPPLRFGPWDFCEAGAETEAFERLVEHEDDVKRDELVACDGESQADEDGVENDTEFEDEDGRELCGVSFGNEFLGFPVGAHFAVGDVVALVAEVVFAPEVGVGRRAVDVLGALLLFKTDLVAMGAGGVTMAIVTVRVVMTLAKSGVPHHHEFEEEHDEDGHEGDAFGPWVRRDDAGQTFMAKSLVCWGEEVCVVSK
jgi:hypothetical protein